MFQEVFSGILGAILGAGITALTIRFNYRDLYARSISASRMEWINNFREEIAIIVATLKTTSCKNLKNDECAHSTIYSAEKARTKILTRINLDTTKRGNEYNTVLSDIMNNIDFKNPYIDNEPYEKALIELTRKILEPEWKRVKKEAGGDKK